MPAQSYADCMTPLRILGTRGWLVVVADLVSWGFAATVLLLAFATEMTLALWQGVVLAAMFLLMRAIAREIRAEHARLVFHENRRRGMRTL